MATDGKGRPLRIILTLGQRGDVTQASALLEGLSPRRVLADKAYDANALRQIIAQGKHRLGDVGRLVIRPSGTEPVIRVMAEGDDAQLVGCVVEEILETLNGAPA